MKPDEKVCPLCAEIIKLKAIKCRHCLADLTTDFKFSSSSVKANTHNLNKIQRNKSYVGWILFAIVITTLALTNPNEKDFKYEIVKKIQESGKIDGSSFIGKLAAGIASYAINSATVRTNYYLFSTFEIDSSLLKNINPDTPRIKFLGIGGMVFPIKDISSYFHNVEKTGNDSQHNVQNTGIDNDTKIDISLPNDVKDVFKSITKDCPTPESKKDVLISDVLLYADPKNKVLVYLARGARSSDLLIFNFKDNSFTKINSLYPENNELHKLSKFDLDRLPIRGSVDSCNFRNELQVEEFFNCNSKDSSFDCKWIY
jgi:hypothetical protein